MSEINYEQEAQKQGWKPKEEFTGPPEKWTDAQTFVEKGEKIAGIATARVKQLEDRLGKMEQTNREFGEFHRKALQKAQQEKEAAIQSLKAQQVKAIEEGDGQAFVKTGEQIKKLESEPVQAPEPQYASEWAAENPWYSTDRAARIFADGVAEDLRRQGSTLEGRAFLDEVARQTREELPHKFKNPNKYTSITSGSGSIEDEQVPTSKSYDALPAEDKAVCDKFIADGLIKDRKEYLSEYEWD